MSGFPDGTKRRILVTGGAGFIGSHLAEALAGAGHQVAVLDDLSTGRAENLPPGLPFHQLDIRSEGAARLVEAGGFEVIYHLAAQIDLRRSMEDPVFDAEANVVGSLNLFEAARRGGIRQIVFASTGGAIYGDQEVFPAPESHSTRPLSAYGVAKLAVERYLYVYHRTYGLDVTCLRFANVYGERQNPHGEAGVVAIFLELLLAGRTPRIHGDGLQTRDYVHVSDVVRANVTALGRLGFGVYNVGTGVETSVVELYGELLRALGGGPPAEHGPAKLGEQRRSSIDPGLLATELGLPRPIPIKDGLARTAAWFRARRGG
ncbi:MAG TPA: NAD-dependent epimerase/dehydratase family protein [Thermoanaerobaculia bacterium]|nr:NAD-dependent epimerase/dehydratase family protein [Thermoanaerobaculia bacterium]